MISSKELYDILMYDDFIDFEHHVDDIFEIIPELLFEFKFDQKNPHHHLDVWEHTKFAMQMSNKNFIERLAILLHDIAKPFTYVDDENGIRHFPNHPEVSYSMSSQILERFDYKEEDKKKVLKLIKYHDTPITFKMISEDIEFAKSLLNIQKCDALAHHPEKLEKRIKYLEETHKKLSLK